MDAKSVVGEVEGAYVMETQYDSNNNVVLGNGFDIGIINADKDCQIARITIGLAFQNRPLAFLRIPER